MTTPRDLTWWHGRLAGSRIVEPADTVMTVLFATDSGCSTFRAMTESGDIYWVEAMGNGQDDQTLVTEQVVAGIGTVMGLCVRPECVLRVPENLAGQVLENDYRLRAGLAHGSAHLEAAEEVGSFEHRHTDHNAQRQVDIYGLWDLFLGQDEQWLCDQAGDYSIWSFDHSLWLARGGGDWDEETLIRLVDVPWPAMPSPTGLDQAAFHDVARRMLHITPEQSLTTAPRPTGAGRGAAVPRRRQRVNHAGRVVSFAGGTGRLVSIA